MARLSEIEKIKREIAKFNDDEIDVYKYMYERHNCLTHDGRVPEFRISENVSKLLSRLFQEEMTRRTK